MISLFLGLISANLLLMGAVFGIGLVNDSEPGEANQLYNLHVLLGVMAGLACALVHVVVFTYFMATTKWLEAARDKADLDEKKYIAPSLKRKIRSLRLAMTAIGVTMAAMLAGAGADTHVLPLWPGELHMALGAAAIAVNVLCAVGEFKIIRDQGRLIDRAAAIVGPAEVMNGTTSRITGS